MENVLCRDKNGLPTHIKTDNYEYLCRWFKNDSGKWDLELYNFKILKKNFKIVTYFNKNHIPVWEERFENDAFVQATCNPRSEHLTDRFTYPKDYDFYTHKKSYEAAMYFAIGTDDLADFSHKLKDMICFTNN